MPPLLPTVPDGPAYAALLRVPGTWLPALAAVADRHGLPRPGAGDGLGGSEVVFAAGPGAVLKISCPLYVPQHEVEKRVLGRLAALPDVGAPRILAAGEIEGWPYLVLERLSGVPLEAAWPEVPPADREAIAEDLGRRLALVHTLAPEGIEAFFLPWEEFVPRQIAGVVEKHRRLGAPEAILADLPAAVARAGPLPRPGVVPTLLHADLTDDNIVIRREGGRWRVSGLVDFADAVAGDPEYDLMVPGAFVAAGDPVLLRALFRGAGRTADLEDPLLPARLAAWWLLHRFGTITHHVGRAPGPPRASLAAAIAAHWPDLRGAKGR